MRVGPLRSLWARDGNTLFTRPATLSIDVPAQARSTADDIVVIATLREQAPPNQEFRTIGDRGRMRTASQFRLKCCA
jgi:hypothetical protein